MTRLGGDAPSTVLPTTSGHAPDGPGPLARGGVPSATLATWRPLAAGSARRGYFLAPQAASSTPPYRLGSPTRGGVASTERPGRGSGGYLLPILSGILAGTSYIPFPPWALFFCFVPLWLFWLRETSWKRVFFGGWIAQFVFTLIGFHWVAHTAHEFGHLPWVVSALVLLLFAGLAHLFVPAAGLVFAVCRSRMTLPRWAQLGLLPALVALFEYAWPMIFPWNLGYAWIWGRLPAYQLAEYVGFQGLSAATLTFNLAFLAAWENRKAAKGMRILGAALFLFAAINGLGWLRGETLPPPDASVRVLIVQGNIGNLAKERAERGEGYREEILARYLELTALGVIAPEGRRPDFAVWPESAFPDTISRGRMDEGSTLVLRRFLKTRSIALVTGARGYEQGSGRRTNSFVVFDEQGEMAAPPYDKSVLLAFGEYVPGSALFPGLKKWFPYTADFGRGDGPQVKILQGLILGPQICYEGLFPGFSRSLSEQGAQVFLNVTNDSWFGTWSEPYQHLYMTLARGIEFRRPVIRATNTGISAAMLSDGTVLETSPLHRAWLHSFDVAYRKEPTATFFQAYGYRLVPAVLLLAPAGILLAAGRRGRRTAS
ncbi:MAG TPA: apolipoprotein N-acyltransferase [Candidatus Deferrimicrobiaceae bacterium]|nr:apolipoprotein N-acyltransferase [Candidatus Deferrimicrobiaceae bacterium]